MSSVRHLYVHLPFCAHRCGYCDFVTVVGRNSQHSAYVDSLLAELALEGDVLVDRLETVFLGGGTPTFTAPADLARLLAALPDAEELTVEANPETVTPELARLLASGRREPGLTRRAEFPAPSARGARATGPAPTTSDERCTFSVMPDSTTSRSTSCTASPARAPPISRAISPTR